MPAALLKNKELKLVYSPTLMKMRILPARFEIPRIRLYTKLALFATLLSFGALSVSRINAQQKLSKRYPVSKNVRIELKNISGTITVE